MTPAIMTAAVELDTAIMTAAVELDTAIEKLNVAWREHATAQTLEAARWKTRASEALDLLTAAHAVTESYLTSTRTPESREIAETLLARLRALSSK
jgi:hypothetical protein